MYDKQGECRVKCLASLQPLYERDELHTRLELFTSRFKARIVEMCLDKEYEVSVCAIKLLTRIISKNDTAAAAVLEDKDCENIYELVFHTNRQIAHAAGEFLKEKLFKIEDNRQGGGAETNNSSLLILLIQFLIESEVFY